jgi:hypothetical protein
MTIPLLWLTLKTDPRKKSSGGGPKNEVRRHDHVGINGDGTFQAQAINIVKSV